MTPEKQKELLLSAIDDIEIVLDYYEIAREEKRKKKITTGQNPNAAILERAHTRLALYLASTTNADQ